MADRFLDCVRRHEHNKFDFRVYGIRRSAALELGKPAENRKSKLQRNDGKGAGKILDLVYDTSAVIKYIKFIIEFTIIVKTCLL